MNTQDKIKALAAIESKGIFSFLAVTKREALKKSRVTKLPTPDHLQSITVVRACTVSLGNNYQDAVNNRRKKEGVEQTFVAEETYCSAVSDNGLVYKHNNRDSYYLRVYPSLCHSFKNFLKYFDLTGKPISLEAYRELELEYFKQSSTPDNQGIDNVVIVNNYSLDNVLYLKRGEVIFNELTEEQVKSWLQ